MRTAHVAVLDTNVLLLLLVASVDISLLRSYKRVSQFTAQDATALEDLLRPFQELATTPHVLSETDNFVDQAPTYRRQDLKNGLIQFIERAPERYRRAKELATLDEFVPLGLSDCGLIDFQQEAVVITTDFRLAGRIQAHHGFAVNFKQYAAAYQRDVYRLRGVVRSRSLAVSCLVSRMIWPVCISTWPTTLKMASRIVV